MQRKPLIAFFVILTVDILGCLYLASQIRNVAHLPFATDEALHANGGLELALDLKAGDWGDAFVHTYKQAYYPPTQSWLLAPAFVLFGATETVARTVNMVCLFVIVLLLYGIGLELHDRYGWLVGLIAALFPFTSQPLLTISAIVMQEPTGLTFTLIALWLYIRGVKHSDNRCFCAAGLTLIAVTLAKYLFGVYLMTTLILVRLIEARLNPQRLFSKSNFALFAPFALGMAVWFFDPSKIYDFWRYANVPPLQAEPFSFENLTFYWRSIVSHYTSSALLGIFLLAALAWELYHWRNPMRLVLATHILVAIAGMTIRRTVNPRFVYVAAPLIYLLAGALVAQIVETLRARFHLPPKIEIVTALICLIALLAIIAPDIRNRYLSYPAMLQVQIKTDPREFDMLAWIADSIPPGQRGIFMINYWDQFSDATVKWYLLTRDTSPGRRFADVTVVSRYAWPIRTKTAPDFMRELEQSKLTHVIGFAGSPEGSTAVWLDAQTRLDRAMIRVSQAEFDLAQWDRTLLNQLRDNQFSSLDTLSEAMTRYSYGYHITATIYRVKR